MCPYESPSASFSRKHIYSSRYSTELNLLDITTKYSKLEKDPATSDKTESYIAKLVELRQKKGMTEEQVKANKKVEGQSLHRV